MFTILSCSFQCLQYEAEMLFFFVDPFYIQRLKKKLKEYLANRLVCRYFLFFSPFQRKSIIFYTHFKKPPSFFPPLPPIFSPGIVSLYEGSYQPIVKAVTRRGYYKGVGRKEKKLTLFNI